MRIMKHMWKEAVILTAAAGCACLARSEYERKHFSVESVQITSGKLIHDRCLVFLSDLHNNEFGPENGKLVETIFRLKPDAVLVGGDMIVTRGKGQGDTRVALSLMKALSSRIPVFYANGNHESRMVWQRHVYGTRYEKFKAALKAMGIVCLENETAALGEDILITGVDLEPRFYTKALFQKAPAMEEDYLYKKLGRKDRRNRRKFHILLAHSPLYFKNYAAWGADLTLSGHFHGGTVRLPVLGGVMTPQYQFFLPWCAGDFQMKGSRMIVSRGLGTHSINIRFNNKPQLVVIQLKKK